MDRINEGTYNTPNQFGDYTELINEYINKIFGQSLDLYLKRYASNNPTGTQKLDIDKIEESMGYIDDYLYYYYSFNSEKEFLSIFENLVDNLNFVTVFPPEKRGYYGEYVDSETLLYINPQLSASSELSSDERTRLYICHELGHIQNAKWMNKLLPELNSLNYSNEDKQLIIDGFSLLDEATTQDRAENITYYYSSKIRPPMEKRSTRLFNNRPFNTNFDYYGEFQEPTINFAKTLRGIGKLSSDESVMEEFDKRSLSGDFADNILYEYRMDGYEEELYYMMGRLGVIKNASYEAFGYGNHDYLEISSNALLEYNQVVNGMRDYRDPIVRR